MPPRRCLALILLALGACRPAETPPADAPAPILDGELIDLTHPFNAETVYWPTAPGFQLSEDFKGTTDAGFYYEANTFTAAEHGGTHLDAPIHFAEGQWTADAIPLDRLAGPAAVVDVRGPAAADPDYQVTTEDLEAWEAAHGPIPEGALLLLHTGHGRHWPDPAAYLGTDRRGPEAVPDLHFPGLHPDAARWLVENRRIDAVGLDTPSVDYGQSATFEAHQILFAANIPAFENVAHLDRLPATGAFVIALPMKIEGGSGGPLRIVGIVRE